MKFTLPALIVLVALNPANLRSQVTLTSLTTNNTSACTAVGAPDAGCYAAFAGLSDPNFTPETYEPKPLNVSKVPISTLMYPSSNTFLFVHFQPWFFQNNPDKIATGYTSDNASTVSAQMTDMISRGFKAVVIDWYGQNGGDDGNTGFDDKTTMAIKSNLAPNCSAAQNCPFYFALMEDKGALALNGCSTSSSTTAACITALETDLTYMKSNYFGSNAYVKLTAPPGNKISSAGRPVVFLFLLPASSYNSATTDWDTVWATVVPWAETNADNPLFWIESQFTPYATYGYPNADAVGAYAWLNWNNSITDYIGKYDTGDLYGFDALTGFYYTSFDDGYYKTQSVAGVGYKGFDDYDSWGSVPNYNHPVIAQDCGQTFVQSFSYAGKYYSSTTQLPFLGVAVWNDYDEGSEIETGIDNCVSSFTETVAGSTLDWDIAFDCYNTENCGSETTVYNYVIYYTTNGTELYEAGTVASGTHTTNLCTLDKSIPSGATIYVQAQGQPSIFNHLVSNPQTYTNSCG